jgi:predicted ferric reductase
MKTEKWLQVFSWALGLGVVAIAIAAWSEVRLTGRELTAYDLFPVFGLSAFGLMWTHFITGTLRRVLRLPPSTLRVYFRLTSWIVFALILLHPGIFVTQLWLDGFGVPPFSYLSVYQDTLPRIALLLGTLSLLMFLAFELRRKYRKAQWWKYVEYANIVAMFAILYHGFTLGQELSLAWLKVIWLFYTLTLVGAVVYNEVYKRRAKHE